MSLEQFRSKTQKTLTDQELKQNKPGRGVAEILVMSELQVRQSNAKLNKMLTKQPI